MLVSGMTSCRHIIFLIDLSLVQDYKSNTFHYIPEGKLNVGCLTKGCDIGTSQEKSTKIVF